MHPWLGVGILCLLSGAAGSDWSIAMPDPPSAKAQAALARAFVAIEVRFDLRSEKSDVQKASAELGRALDVLAASIDDATAKRLAAVEARDMQAKLVAIAWDRRQHPERYRELQDSYDATRAKLSGPPQRAPSAPPLKEKHLKDAYRLAWEFRLLDPGTDEYKSMFLPRAYALPLLQNTVGLQDFFEKTGVQGSREPLLGNAQLGWVRL